MSLGDNLKNLRECKKITQKQMSEILGVSKSNISKYESNDVEPNIETLKRYSSYFNVSTDFLLELKKGQSNENDCVDYFYEEGDANWNIKQIVESKGMNYEELLVKTCIEKTRLDAIIYGNSQPTAEELIRLSNVLNVSIDYLLDTSKRERIFDDEEIILRYYSRDKENIMMLLESYCNLDKKGRAIVLGKCIELEDKHSVAEDVLLQEAK